MVAGPTGCRITPGSRTPTTVRSCTAAARRPACSRKPHPPAIPRRGDVVLTPTPGGWLGALLRFTIERKLVVFLLALVAIGWGLLVAPFDWEILGLERDPVPVDAIPDIGENQQIVFTEWPGRSPQDIEDQITYPLTTALLGIPGVRTVRSFSVFGFSTIYVIFRDEIDFYWSRSRILERLSSLPSGALPADVHPRLGPDATALGQVFWYTLEGRDARGRPSGGWDLAELRSIQDWHVRYALLSAEGVSEVASVGGFVREYQVDVDPDALRAYGVGLHEVFDAVRRSNVDVGARTIEVNRAEYVIRGVGFVKQLSDIENAVISVRDNVPIYVRNVAHVSRGPALRRGALDRGGAEVVGGVVVVRHGANPLETIQNVREKIAEISPGLPRKRLADGTESQVTIVPFYDRTDLIHETLDTLRTALSQEILITIIVVLIMVLHFGSSLLISGLLPLAVLLCFVAMKLFGVDANIVALSGIAIAIGTMVDMGIIISENILRRLREAGPAEDRRAVILRASREVGGAVLTAVATTIVSFLPVFTMVAAEGKLFRPLAFTKTFALLASLLVALLLIPPLSHLLFRRTGPRVGHAAPRPPAGRPRSILLRGLPLGWRPYAARLLPWLAALGVGVLLADYWLPLGPERGLARNVLFVGGGIAVLLLFFHFFQRVYPRLLACFLARKLAFLWLPLLLVLLGVLIWQGFGPLFGWLPAPVKRWGPVSDFAHTFPGLGREFMPPLDEGAFLYMPTTMPHASIGEALDVLQKQDMALARIPEVEDAVGKIGRAETPLDPAPISMIETLITYHPEYLVDASGRRLRFRYDPDSTDLARDASGEPLPAPDGEPYHTAGAFLRDEEGALIPDPRGRPFRIWRPPLDPDLNPGRAAWAGVRDPDDIWDAIRTAAQIPGTTSAPKLQPISTRLVMLQSGMRAPMGIKIKGPDLETIERLGIAIEQALREVPAVVPASVFADRIVGKPYIEIVPDRQEIARYGIQLQGVQDVIEVAIGGKSVTMTVEGRERYAVRVRYMRELRDEIESLGRILVAAPGGAQIPLAQLAEIRYVRGPQTIKSEDTFLVGYVLFDGRPGWAEVDVVEQARAHLARKIGSGEITLPSGVSYRFAGSYENQVRAQKKLTVILPLALLIIFLILYFQFQSISTSLLVFSGVFVAWSGGFLMIWLYGQPWFLDVDVYGLSLREVFQVHPVNLSVAVWVGFLALFGIATDDGVLIATYLKQAFADRQPRSVAEIRTATLEAGRRRVRPALMTSATTLLALLPVLTSSGRGADVMVPMAIPTFGGMAIAVITLFVVPLLYAAIAEARWRRRSDIGV
ncbi:MAG: AcrB/AcrD/AcrF family protein [Candidatus Eisenbacteria bacterium]|nr:AcrB/AcrD/AcrF family protein [Candidatus Eisenbacteria bacterium]